jgi:hypothetical protein
VRRRSHKKTSEALKCHHIKQPISFAHKSLRLSAGANAQLTELRPSPVEASTQKINQASNDGVM